MSNFYRATALLITTLWGGDREYFKHPEYLEALIGRIFNPFKWRRKIKSIGLEGLPKGNFYDILTSKGVSIYADSRDIYKNLLVDITSKAVVKVIEVKVFDLSKKFTSHFEMIESAKKRGLNFLSLGVALKVMLENLNLPVDERLFLITRPLPFSNEAYSVFSLERNKFGLSSQFYPWDYTWRPEDRLIFRVGN